MKLAEKGRFVAPPKLRGAAGQRVVETLGTWEGVHCRTHWFLGDEEVVDGADFYFGQKEIGHVHLDSEAHVMMPSAVAKALVSARLALPFPWGRNIVVFAISTMADVEHALWLFELSYDCARGVATADLLARCAEKNGQRTFRDSGPRSPPMAPLR
ncbi:hypothetical protein BH09MYX1_BH09MYX1_28440 [soil metagenome]